VVQNFVKEGRSKVCKT